MELLLFLGSRGFFFGLDREEKLSRCVAPSTKRSMRRQTPYHHHPRLKHSRSPRFTSHVTSTRTALRKPRVDPAILRTVLSFTKADPLLGNGPALPHGYSHACSTVRRKHTCQATGEKGYCPIPEWNYFRRQERCRACRGLEAAYEGAGFGTGMRTLEEGRCEGLLVGLGLGGPGYCGGRFFLYPGWG